MKKPRSFKVELLQIACVLLVVVFYAIDIKGTPLRTVHILTLIAGSLTAGIPLGRLIERKRIEKSHNGTKREEEKSL